MNIFLLPDAQNAIGKTLPGAKKGKRNTQDEVCAIAGAFRNDKKVEY